MINIQRKLKFILLLNLIFGLVCQKSVEANASISGVLTEGNLSISPEFRDLNEEITDDFQRGNIEGSLKSIYEQLKRIDESSSTDNTQANEEVILLMQAGFVYNNSGLQKNSISFFEKADAILKDSYEASKDRNSKADINALRVDCLNALSIAYKISGNYEKSLEKSEFALEVIGDISLGDFEEAYFDVYLNIGETYLISGKYATAIETFTEFLKALEIQEADSSRQSTENHLLKKMILSNYLSRFYLHSDQLSLSEEYKNVFFEAYNNIANTSSAPAGNKFVPGSLKFRLLSNLSYSYFILGKNLEAENLYAESIGLGNLLLPDIKEASYPVLGVDLLDEEAQNKIKKTLENIKSTEHEILEILALNYNSLGNILYEREDFINSRKAIEDSVTALDSLTPRLEDNNNFFPFEIRQVNFHLSQKVSISLADEFEALKTAERARRFAIDNFLLKFDHSYEKSEEFNISELDVKNSANHLNSAIVYYSVISSSEIFVWVIRPGPVENPIHFRQIEISPSNTTLIRNTTGFNQSSSLIDRGQQATALAQLLRGTRDSLGIEDENSAQLNTIVSTGSQKDYLQDLHRLLIDPISDLIADLPEERIIFVPDGHLSLVPFPALQNSKTDKYLIQDFAISTATQLHSLIHSQATSSRSTTDSQGLIGLDADDVLIVGNPTMPDNSLDALPFSEQEANEIAEKFGTEPILGPGATETAVKERMPQSRIIHMATHGLLESVETENIPIPGAIALAPSGDDDGFLTSLDVTEMNLNADLVVLSACRTAWGNQIGGSVFGLPFSLTTAGADSVVVSLWSIPDAPQTFILMEEFYNQLISYDDKAEALRNAMLTVMKEYPDPFNWAGFVLIE